MRRLLLPLAALALVASHVWAYQAIDCAWELPAAATPILAKVKCA